MSGNNKEEKVYGIFQNIAEGYDSANNRISLGMQKSWKKSLIRMIQKNGDRCHSALDVCCGTGDIARMLADQFPQSRITGLDFSEEMLKVARKTTSTSMISYVQGNAMALPFEDNTFDLVTISFGLRNTADYRQVLREMRRVVKEDGYIYCMDSFVPDSKLVKPFYKLYFKFLMPLLGGGGKHHMEYMWLYESTKVFLTKNQLKDLYRSIGLKEIRDISHLFGSCTLVCGKK